MLTAGDYQLAHVFESTSRHLDLIARPPAAAGPSAETLAASRASLERIAGTPFPASFSDTDALLTGTGRRTPTAEEKAALDALAAGIPFVLG